MNVSDNFLRLEGRAWLPSLVDAGVDWDTIVDKVGNGHQYVFRRACWDPGEVIGAAV